MPDEIPEQFGGRPILPVGKFYPSIFKSLSLFSSGKENTDTVSSAIGNATLQRQFII